MFGWTSDVQRLKTRPQFQAALACGIVARTTHFALHRTALLPAAPAEAGVSGESQSRHPKLLFGVQDVWIGAMVPKRWARRAVTRNAIRRQIYQVGSTFGAQLPPAAHVVRLRATFDRSQFISATSDVLKRAVRGELEQLFARVTIAPVSGRPA